MTLNRKLVFMFFPPALTARTIIFIVVRTKNMKQFHSCNTQKFVHGGQAQTTVVNMKNACKNICFLKFFCKHKKFFIVLFDGDPKLVCFHKSNKTPLFALLYFTLCKQFYASSNRKRKFQNEF